MGPIIPGNREVTAVPECVYKYHETRVPEYATFNHQTGTVRDGLSF